MNSREAAYLAVMASVKGDQYAADFLDFWKQKESPSSKDDHLAREIAFGTIQRKLSLDYLAAQLTPQKKLNVKTKELVLLRTALYQYYFMDRIPIYALTNETQQIAKKYCHRTFVGFLNAVLRQLETTELKLPVESLSISYSYPEYFVDQLIKDYGLEQSRAILEMGNKPAQVMARKRSTLYEVELCKVSDVADSSDYYIQNRTPVELIKELSSTIVNPQTVLDLCASPGGKTVLIHDIFPAAKLFANDVSEEKLKRIRENLTKYTIAAEVTCGPGESYPRDKRFDLVIVDAPCSNTGVLNKRSEARWRLSVENVKALEDIQLKLIENASHIGSFVWYMTCSILREENEAIVQKACQLFGLEKIKELTILPDEQGNDGGYGCAMRKR